MPRSLSRSTAATVPDGGPVKPAHATKPDLEAVRATIHEDETIAEARRLCARGRHAEAHFILQSLVDEQPRNAAARKLLLQACLSLRLALPAAVHGDWLVSHLVRSEQDGAACDVYVRLVKSGLPLAWKQATLVSVGLAATRARRRTVLIDAADRLRKLFPRCRNLPPILLAAAGGLAAKGRRDLARRTLRLIITRYPDHVDAIRARQQLERMRAR
jgi:hypothetical protein